MKRIYLNLKRFDIPKSLGGVNEFAKPEEWSKTILKGIEEGLKKYSKDEAEFCIYFPELHLFPALEYANDDFPAKLGAQKIYKNDVSIGGNFGAFTGNATAKSTKALGAETAMVGHCEERNEKQEIIREFLDVENKELNWEIEKSIQHTVNKILNQEILRAQEAGLHVLYCIGEKDWELDNREEVLKEQIETGLKDVDIKNVTIAYEPVWAIGPGKTPATKEDIQEVAKFIKSLNEDFDILYGGGLKLDNAKILASIPEIAGGLIALTSFTDPIGFYPNQYLEIIEEYMNNITE